MLDEENIIICLLPFLQIIIWTISRSSGLRYYSIVFFLPLNLSSPEILAAHPKLL